MDEWKGKKCCRERVTGAEWYQRRGFKKGEGKWNILVNIWPFVHTQTVFEVTEKGGKLSVKKYLRTCALERRLDTSHLCRTVVPLMHACVTSQASITCASPTEDNTSFKRGKRPTIRKKRTTAAEICIVCCKTIIECWTRLTR